MPDPTQTLVALDAAGRPHAVRVYADERVRGSPTLTYDLSDGTPVERIGRGHYRTTGSPPHVDLFTADADAADLPPAGSWSATATVAVTNRRHTSE